MSCRRRRWALEEKREICAEARRPGLSVSGVARRYALNANLLFKWLKDERFAPSLVGTPSAEFLPVSLATADPAMDVRSGPRSTCDAGGIVIELHGGLRVLASGGYDPDRLGRLLRVWGR